MLMDVQVPHGAPPGALLTVQAPTGQLIQVQVPAGVGPGQVLRVQVPAAAPPPRAVAPPQPQYMQGGGRAHGHAPPAARQPPPASQPPPPQSSAMQHMAQEEAKQQLLGAMERARGGDGRLHGAGIKNTVGYGAGGAGVAPPPADGKPGKTCCFQVETGTVHVVERCGAFDRIALPGLNCLIPCLCEAIPLVRTRAPASPSPEPPRSLPRSRPPRRPPRRC